LRDQGPQLDQRFVDVISAQNRFLIAWGGHGAELRGQTSLVFRVTSDVSHLRSGVVMEDMDQLFSASGSMTRFRNA
jgi:hypothetical protein